MTDKAPHESGPAPAPESGPESGPEFGPESGPAPIDIVLLLTLATVWSLSFAAIKVAVVTIPPVTLAALRLAVAAVVLWMLMRRRGGRLPPFSAAQWPALFVIALLGNGIPFFLIGWGEIKIDSGIAAVLMAVMPLATALMAHFFTTSEKLTGIKFLGVCIGFSGVVVAAGADALAGMGDEAVRQAAVACGALCYGVAAVLARRLPPAGPVDRSAAVIVIAAAQMILVSLVLDAPWALSPAPEAWAAVLYLGLFPTALAAVIYFRLIAARGATFISYNNYLIPVLGLGWGILFLGETAGLKSLAALALVLTGIAVAARRPRKKA